VFAGSTPIGGLVTGAIASTFGAAVAIGLGGAASLATGVGAIARLRGRPMRPLPISRVPEPTRTADPIPTPGAART
jgi:hypothetical protein